MSEKAWGGRFEQEPAELAAKFSASVEVDKRLALQDIRGSQAHAEMLAARGIIVSHETVRRWALKFGQEFANRIRRRLPRAGDKWHLDVVAIKIAGVILPH